MKVYECLCCNYKTSLKADYTRHTKTKRHNRNNLEQNGNKTEQNGNKTEQKYAKSIKSFACKYCEKGFASEKSMKRHIAYTCKKNDDEDLKELVRLLNLQLKQQEEQFQEQIDEQKKQNKCLQKQINQLSRKLQMNKISHKNSHNNTIQSSNNNNNSNNQIYNIQLLNYDKTDYSHLTEKDYIKCINDVNHCVKTLICKVHFNPQKPENHNIYISNLKSKNVMVYKNGKWMVADRKSQITDIYDDNHFVLEEWYEQYKDKYPSIVKSFNRYLKNKDDDVVLSDVKELIIKVLYNERDIVETTRDKLCISDENEEIK